MLLGVGIQSGVGPRSSGDLEVTVIRCIMPRRGEANTCGRRLRGYDWGRFAGCGQSI